MWTKAAGRSGRSKIDRENVSNGQIPETLQTTVFCFGGREETKSPMSENQKHSLDATSQTPERPSKIAKLEQAVEVTDEQEQEPGTMNSNPRLQRYLVAIEYIGTRFSGSQQQLSCRTVVGVLQVLYSSLHF